MKFEQGLIDRIRAAQRLVVFTGAGVSQESGVPTFRDALTGLWENFDPDMLATPQAFSREPDLVWGWYEWRRQLVTRCKPNPAHIAIASLAAKAPKFTLITQNVDDLHERAGSREVVHLHGSLHRPRCFVCGAAHRPIGDGVDEPAEGRRIMPPNCLQCGEKIRPGVVWFGEQLPAAEWDKARRAVGDCDLLICIGTSSLVFPTASLPYLASEHHACIVQVNPVRTELDTIASYSLRGKAGTVMEALSEALM